MADRPELKTFSIPVDLHDPLRKIAEMEHRSMSGVVSAMIAERAQELGLIQRGGYDESAQEEAERQAA